MVERKQSELRSPVKNEREYRSWYGMIRRCYRAQNDRHWNRYGGRGIQVCKRWFQFQNFLSDMGERPAGMTLDRINGDGHYEPSNCRWATMEQQLEGRYNPRGEERPNAKVTASEVQEMRSLLKLGLSQRSVAKAYGISQTNIRLINNYGSWRHV